MRVMGTEWGHFRVLWTLERNRLPFCIDVQTYER